MSHWYKECSIEKEYFRLRRNECEKPKMKEDNEKQSIHIDLANKKKIYGKPNGIFILQNELVDRFFSHWQWFRFHTFFPNSISFQLFHSVIRQKVKVQKLFSLTYTMCTVYIYFAWLLTTVETIPFYIRSSLHFFSSWIFCILLRCYWILFDRMNVRLVKLATVTTCTFRTWNSIY